MRARAVLFGLFAVLACVVSAQQAPPTFSARVDAVTVDVFVTDAAGNPVHGLTVEDFELTEDNRSQTITSFSEVRIPINRPGPFSLQDAHPDVTTNTGKSERLYVIAVDEILPALALRARTYLREFIDQHFEPSDVGAVVHLGRTARSDAQDFTSDRGLLLAAIDRVKGWPGGTMTPRGQPEAALRALAESLARITERRKALILITHDVGDVYDALDGTNRTRSRDSEDLRIALMAAMKSGIAIYALNPCGLSPGGVLGDEEAAGPGDCHIEAGKVMAFREISAVTGGFAVVNSNGFEPGLERIVRENSNYYVLGFTSSNQKDGGQYRRLHVRVNRPNLTVRARNGYVSAATPPTRTTKRASTATSVQGVRAAVTSPVANGAFPLKVSAPAFRGRTAREGIVVIVTELNTSQLTLVASGDKRVGQIEFAAVAVSAIGKVMPAQRHVIDLEIESDGDTGGSARLVSAMTLPRGRYQLRVGVGNAGASAAGTVMYDLDIPNYGKNPLSLSGIVLGMADDRTSMVAVGATSPSILPIAPTLAREFDTGTVLSVFVEGYDNTTDGPHTIDLAVDFQNSDGRVIRSLTDRRSRTAKGTERFRLPVSLDLPSGSYVLRATLTSDKAVAVREIQVHIR